MTGLLPLAASSPVQSHVRTMFSSRLAADRGAGVQFLTSTTVTSIDFKKKEISMAGESPVQYGKLLLSTGSTVSRKTLTLIQVHQAAQATHSCGTFSLPASPILARWHVIIYRLPHIHQHCNNSSSHNHSSLDRCFMGGYPLCVCGLMAEHCWT